MQVVKYIGTAHRRRITARDWQQAGVEGESVEWSWENGFAIPADQFTDSQMREVIQADSGFAIEEGEEDDVKPRRLQHRMTGQQFHESPRVDMMGAVGAATGARVSTDGSEASNGPSGSGPTPGGGGTKPQRVTTGTGSGSD